MEHLHRILRPLRQRIFLMLARGLFKALEEESGQPKLTVQLLDGEAIQDMELMQPYGLATSPPENADCLAVFPGGDRSMGLVLAVEDRRKRPKGLAPEEVALYGGGDVLAKGEEPPELPEELPEGWPAPPEEPWDPTDPESPPPLAMHRMTFKEGREVEVVCNKLTVRALEGVEITTLGSLSLLYGTELVIGQYMEPMTVGGEEGTRLAKTGDCVAVEDGSSAGMWPIIGDCPE